MQCSNHYTSNDNIVLASCSFFQQVLLPIVVKFALGLYMHRQHFLGTSPGIEENVFFGTLPAILRKKF